MSEQVAIKTESVWTKQDVVELKTLAQKVIQDDWACLRERHELGLRLREKKKSIVHGTFTKQLQILGEQINYSYEEMQKCMRFARIFPEFEKFKAQYREDDAPSWHEVEHKILYNPAESASPSDSSPQALHYGRWVVNWAEGRAWLESVGLKICSKLLISKSQALEEGLILLAERERIPLPPEHRGERMPAFSF